MIADEPTTALDVIVQDRILHELRRIQKDRQLSMLYISHDRAVVAELADIVGVMYAGTIVEMGPVAQARRSSTNSTSTPAPATGWCSATRAGARAEPPHSDAR